MVEGKSHDIFIGKVSEDGTEWVADWITYPEYFITTDKFDRHQLEVTDINPRGPLVFKKVVETE